MIGLTFLIVIILTSCTKYAKQEQLKQLDETNAAALSAEQLLAQKKAEHSDWEAKVAAKQKVLDAKKAEKTELEKKLAH
jgi:septal ring factor EnvC (AmiA/AmiB activator)